MRKHSELLATRKKKQIKTILKCHFTLDRMIKLKKTIKYHKMLGQMGVGHRCTTGENKINPDTTETSMDVSQIRIIMII